MYECVCVCVYVCVSVSFCNGTVAVTADDVLC